MTFFADLHEALDALEALVGGDIDAAKVPAAVNELSDLDVERVIRAATVLVQRAECVRIAGSGAVAARSSRDAGHGGMAQKRGHRNAVSLIQDLTGTTRTDATKQVRLGESLLAATLPPEDPAPDAGPSGEPGSADPADGDDRAPVRPWDAELSSALVTGAVSKDQLAAIRRGLGCPPPLADGDDDPDAGEAWRLAAERLLDEATQRTVEELERAARSIRDLLDPAGAAERFAERYGKRSYRMYTGEDGLRRGLFVFDDEAAAWVQTLIDTALRPRRGGPRFVDAEDAARAQQLAADPRTNDQLAYDLLIDVLRAGSLADAATVFGTRQAGLRIVTTRSALDADEAGQPAVALIEDDGSALPAWLAAAKACDTGATSCTVDASGNPLDVGREQRLFTPKQRIALAVRDGGCRWTGCDRPASYCEAHHCDTWADGGRTDIDRGILLCRFHHMNLHQTKSRITRDGTGDFVLHPPSGGGRPSVLAERLVRRYAFGDLQPPPARYRPAA